MIENRRDLAPPVKPSDEEDRSWRSLMMNAAYNDDRLWAIARRMFPNDPENFVQEYYDLPDATAEWVAKVRRQLDE